LPVSAQLRRRTKIHAQTIHVLILVPRKILVRILAQTATLVRIHAVMPTLAVTVLQKVETTRAERQWAPLLQW
jgi:hypothetical protein